MKHSYTHSNKTFSVIALADGSALEIRRGDRTFRPADSDCGRWASLDAWKATWPADAEPVVPTPHTPPRTSVSNAAEPMKPTSCTTAPPAPRKAPKTQSLASMIMKRFCVGVKSNIVELDSCDVNHIHRCAADLQKAQAELAAYEKSPPTDWHGQLSVRVAKHDLEYNQGVLGKDGIQQFLDGKLPFAPKIECHSRVFVYHNDRIYPVYHNKQKDLVYVRIHGKGFFTPEELGITMESKFFKHTHDDDVFVPM
jgi:hypothetical protein